MGNFQFCTNLKIQKFENFSEFVLPKENEDIHQLPTNLKNENPPRLCQHQNTKILIFLPTHAQIDEYKRPLSMNPKKRKSPGFVEALFVQFSIR